MKKFEILEHKADLKIRAFGENKEELFLNMLLGMNAGLRPELKAQSSKRKTIKVKSLDPEALLVDFLSEVLYLTQVNREIYNKVRFTKLTDSELEAELFGQTVKRFDEDIKAVTYHGLEIKKTEGGKREATILFDI